MRSLGIDLFYNRSMCRGGHVIAAKIRASEISGSHYITLTNLPIFNNYVS